MIKKTNLKFEKLNINPLFFWILVFFSIFFLCFTLKEFKNSETKISTKLAEYKYLKYLLTYKVPPLKKKKISSENIENELRKKGFSPEIVKNLGEGNIELTFSLSFKELAKLLYFFQEKNIKIKSFKTLSISEDGDFKIKLVIY